MGRAATASLPRSLNRTAILNLIRTESPIARSEIARRLNMSLPTVTRVVEKLIQEDLVYFHGSEHSGSRRRPLLEMRGRPTPWWGVHLGGTKMYGTVSDLNGIVQHEVYQAPPTAKGHHFLALEDEAGFINVIVRPRVYERLQEVLRGSPPLIVGEANSPHSACQGSNPVAPA